MVIIHIYGTRAIFLLFCNHQDTESKSRVVEIGVTGPIFTHKYQRLYGTTVSILYKMGENIVAILHIYGARSIFLLYCDHQDTESES